jgi:hypothetical protein
VRWLQLLGVAHHLLLNELCRSPTTVLDGVARLMRQAIDLDTGSMRSSTAPVILYVARLASRVDSYVDFVVRHARASHATLPRARRWGARALELDVSPRTLAELEAAHDGLRALLHGEMHAILASWCVVYSSDVDLHIAHGVARLVISPLLQGPFATTQTYYIATQTYYIAMLICHIAHGVARRKFPLYSYDAPRLQVRQALPRVRGARRR